jgi:hypothetical protein
MDETHIVITSPTRQWVVVAEVSQNLEDWDKKPDEIPPKKCCICGETHTSQEIDGELFDFPTRECEIEILEMYTAEGVDIAHNAKAYRFAKRALRVGKGPAPFCEKCVGHYSEILYNPDIL